MSVKRFEDLKVWQDARSFVVMIYKLTTKKNFQKDFGMRDQIQRASVSIINNIAEGFERDNNKEFIKFLLYSKGSAGEVRSLIYIAYDLKYITEEEFNTAFNDSLNIISQLSKFISYLKNNLK